MRKAPEPKNVLMALWLAGSPGRKHLQGALRFANSGRGWNVRILPSPDDFTADVIRQAERDGTDGFLVCVGSAAADALAKSRIPTVLMDFPPPALLRRRTALTLMFNDEEGVGAKGAAYLRSLGTFASYAFIPDAANRGWSRLRERGFKAELRKQGIRPAIYDRRREDLVDWLKSLPRPAAVMAAYDFGAKEALECCRAAKLKVPDDIAMLGVDNDELLCDYAKPSLSSIRIDHEQHGYKSAEILDRLMHAKKPQGLRKVFLPADEIVERETTKSLPVSAYLARRAQEYIESNAVRGIGVEDVVAHLGVSRRLADLRFAQATGTSLRRAIEDRRLEEVKRRLSETKLPIDRIARLSGYSNPLRLKYVFKARTGLTMSDWRKGGRP